MTHFIGWDVGGWNCDKNSKSRDAIAILDPELRLVGKPWRGNLTSTINAASEATAWVSALFELCDAEAHHGAVVIGVDTPLGFPAAFLRLAGGRIPSAPPGKSCENPYLFRATERYLFERGKSPLSAIKDMIGSQATKGMHALARFAPNMLECGVWGDGQSLRAIEVYPSSCKASSTVWNLRRRYESLADSDREDALTCAVIAHLFVSRRAEMVDPPIAVAKEEGWIWLPTDALS